MKIGTWDRDAVRFLLTSQYRRWGLVFCGLILGALLLGSLLRGVPTVNEGQGEVASLASEGGPSALWALVATIIVVGLLYGSLWGFHALTRQGRLAREGMDLVHLRTSIRLGSNQMLHVIQFGSQVLLVGSSAAGLVLLARMPEPSSREPLPDFKGVLDEALTREAQ